MRHTFFDKDNDLDLTAPEVAAGAADADIATTFKTVGATAPEEPEGPVIPDVPEDEQLVKIDGVMDDRYSEYNSIDIVDAYADGGVDPEQNFDDVTGKLYFNMDASDPFWLEYISGDGKMLDGMQTVRIDSFDQFLTTFEKPLKSTGMIAWDTNVPATANVASTICGLDGYLPVKYDTSSGSLYNKLKSMGVPEKMSLVGKFTGKGTICIDFGAPVRVQRCNLLEKNEGEAVERETFREELRGFGIETLRIRRK